MKTNDEVFVCVNCGCKNIEMKAWMDVNNHEFIHCDNDSKYYCPICEETFNTCISLAEWLKKKDTLVVNNIYDWHVDYINKLKKMSDLQLIYEMKDNFNCSQHTSIDFIKDNCNWKYIECKSEFDFRIREMAKD